MTSKDRFNDSVQNCAAVRGMKATVVSARIFRYLNLVLLERKSIVSNPDLVNRDLVNHDLVHLDLAHLDFVNCDLTILRKKT